MRVFITGASGLIGSALTQALLGRGDEVVALSRGARESQGKLRWVRGTSSDKETLRGGLDGCDAVVNLAGESVAALWTQKKRRAIRESRVGTTQALTDAFLGMSSKPKVLVSVSGAGYYGTSKDGVFDEASPNGSGFLAEVCRDWEAATIGANKAGVRVAILRTGMVLAKNGGALAPLLLSARLGAAGPMGDGKQWVSWITLEDEVRLILHAVDTPGVSGIVNAVAPEAVHQGVFAKALARAVGRPALLMMPAFVLRVVMGQMGEEIILGGQHVVPKRAVELGFRFKHATLEHALRAVIDGP